MTGLRCVRVGCAVGADRVIAVVSRHRGAPVPFAVDVPVSEAPLHDRISAAFAAALASALEPLGKRAAARVVIRVALLPPLAQVRRLALPPMRDGERSRVLSREASGYFFGVRDAQVAAGYSLPARRSTQNQVIAAAAPVALLDALSASVAGSASIDAFVPAAATWAASLPRRGGSATINATGDADITIAAKRGLITDVRHRAAAADEALPTSTGTRLTAGDAATIAARYAWLARAPLLRTNEQQLRLRRARSTRSRTATAAVVALLLASAGGAYVSLQRQLAAVRRARAALAPALAPAHAARDSLLRLEHRLAAAGVLGAGAPWTELLTTVTRTLPADAHIVYMTGVGDSVMFRIEAAAAAEVLPALRVAPVFQDLRIAGAIERDATDPEAAADRFDIAAAAIAWRAAVMRSLTARDRRALKLGAVITGAALLLFAGLLPALREFATARNTLASERGLLARERDVVRGAPAREAKLRAAQATLAAFAHTTFDAAEPELATLEVARLIESIAKLGDLDNVRSAPLGIEVTDDEITRLRVRVTGEADFAQLMLLLQRIEAGPDRRAGCAER
jgi:hypothetical protein